MRNLKRVLLGVFVLLLISAVLVFMLENQQSVSLLFLGWAGPQLPISVVIIQVLLLGMVIGPILGWMARRAGLLRGRRD